MADLYPREEVWSTYGPTCPHCGREYTPDEAHYFNPAGYPMDCDGCGKKFHVEVETEITWTCRQQAVG